MSSGELTYDPNKVVRDRPVFSSFHPLIPKHYVPEWQLDMKNRRLIIQNAVQAKNQVWKGHVTYFLNGRERVAATNHVLYRSILNYTRNLHPNKSHLSKYNSSLLNTAPPLY